MILKYIVLRKMVISKPYIKTKWKLHPGSVRKDINIDNEYNYITITLLWITTEILTRNIPNNNNNNNKQM